VPFLKLITMFVAYKSQLSLLGNQFFVKYSLNVSLRALRCKAGFSYEKNVSIDMRVCVAYVSLINSHTHLYMSNKPTSGLWDT